MKYPQLVSTRAVSAISDWLVTQLEQLGVDASSVYSRLLLSLLHTPLQINALDLAEISDNKVGQLARNKSNFGKGGGGGAAYRRFSAADTEAVKRLAAIDSLLEAVPSDQQLSKIEKLVDELSLKLREIEEQNGLEDSVFEIGQSDDSNLCHSKLDPNDKKSEVSDDPARRYFNAFPALSDQSQTDYSHKKASWPHVSNIVSSSSSSSSSSGSSNSNLFGSQQPSSNTHPSSSTCVGSAGASGNRASGSGVTVVATKKKTKRRRVTNPMAMASNWSNTNQIDAKTNAQPSMQMQSSKVSSSSGGGTANNSTARMARNANQPKSNQRKKPTDMWDTDFDGAWEMGRDLIREFVLKQNNRNRSVSECETTVATATLQTPMKDGTVTENAMDLPCHGKDASEKQRQCTNDDYEENLMRVAAAATTVLFGKSFDMNLYAPLNQCDSETVSSSCSRITTDSSSQQLLMANDKAMQRSEGYSTPDTLASWNEIESAVTPRRDRDYESMQYTSMDGNNAKFGCQIAIDSGSDCVDSGCDENTCLAAFEAKFDHNVEALWNDCKSNDEPKSGTQGMMMDGQHSFWFDYDKQVSQPQPNTIAHVDQFQQFFQANPTAITSYAMHHNGFGGVGGAKLNRGGFATVTAAAASQANNMNLVNVDTSSVAPAAMPTASTIGGMNLTSTIWTDTPNNNEDDVSFYANARLWEMNQSKSMGQKFNFCANNVPVGGVGGAGSNNNATTVASAVSTNFDIGNYETASFSKWSDTELPILPIQSDDVVDHSPLNSMNENEKKIRKNLFGNSYFYNYQLSQRATGNNSTNDGLTLAATSAENSNSICTAEYPFGRAKNAQMRKITLVNHSTSSCFKEVEPLSFEAKQELYSMNNVRKLHTIDTLNEPEDLLTSERTRFRPIKQTYADGYAFDISNKLDHINYERSKSGLLYHNSEVYREYYVYDEDGNGGASSRCDDDNYDGGAAAEFTLKYCIRQNDKSCQTDDSIAVAPRRPPSTKSNAADWLDATRIRSASSLSTSCYEQAENNSVTSTSTLDKLMDVSQDGWCLDENRQCCNNNNNNNNNSVRALWEHCATCSMDVVSMPANRRLKDELSADGDEIMKDLKHLIQSISFQSDWEDDDTMTAANEDSNAIGTTKAASAAAATSVVTATKHTSVARAQKPKIRSSVSRQLFPGVNKLSGDSGGGDSIIADADDAMGDDQNQTANDDDEFNSNLIYSNVSKLISDLLQPEKAQTLVEAISQQQQQNPFAVVASNFQERLLAMDSESGSSSIQNTKDVPKDTTKNERMCNTNNNCSSSASPSANRTNSANKIRNNSSSNNTHSNNSNNNNGHFGSLWAYNDNSIWRREPPAKITAAKSAAPDTSATMTAAAVAVALAATAKTTATTATRLCDQWEHANLEKIWKNDATLNQQQQPQNDTGQSMNADNEQPPPQLQLQLQQQQPSIDTDKTINYTETLNEKCQPTTTTISDNKVGADHSKSDMNTLEKFWQLIKQANAAHDNDDGKLASSVAEPKMANTRYDRKRRHSATTNHHNYFDHCTLNNCDAFENIKKLATKTITDGYDGVNIMNCDAKEMATGGNGGDCGGTTTIITCKYWTANWDSFCVTSTLAFNNNNNNNINNNDDDNLFNCYHNPTSKYHPNCVGLNDNDSILMQPTSTFLKQVAAMVSRPLTR